MSKSKEDYYNTPNSELGDNNDVIVEGDENLDENKVDDKVDPPKDDKPAPKESLSDEELNKLKALSPDKNNPADKPKENTPPANTEDYEIEVDDDSPLTDDDINDIVKTAEAKGLTKEQAQEEISRRETLIKRGMSAETHKANKIIEGYESEVNSHPLFATREVREDTMVSVNEALNRFFDDGFKERFELFYKRDIHLLTALHRLGKPFVASTGMPGTPMGGFDRSKEALTPGTDAHEEARLKRLYPENF